MNCNAVCNTSYFKLRCEGNAVCNVLQIASKFYHLKPLKGDKKLINCKMDRFNNILLWIQLDTNLFELGMQNSQSTLHLVRTLFCPRTLRNYGGHKNQFVRPSIGLSVRPSVCHKNSNLAHIFWSVKDITLMFGMSYPWKKSFQLAPWRDFNFDLNFFQGNLFCPPGGQQLSEFACKVYFLHCSFDMTSSIRGNKQNGCFLRKRWCRIDKNLECPTSKTSVGVLLTVLSCF